MVEKIVVEVVRAEALELLVEIFVQVGSLLDEILRKLRGKSDFGAEVILLDDLSESVLRARINVCSVEVVDAELDGAQELRFRLLHVDRSALRGKTHTSES